MTENLVSFEVHSFYLSFFPLDAKPSLHSIGTFIGARSSLRIFPQMHTPAKMCQLMTCGFPWIT